MRVRDRSAAVVVTLAFVLVALGSAAGPAAAAPPPGNRPAAGPLGAAPAAGCRAGSDPVAVVGAYPGRPCAELSGGWWGDRRGGVAYGDGPDEPLPAAPPSVAGPVVSARSVPARRPPAPPLRPRGVRAARAPPTA
ncbi:hypothetical protein [Micromonospora sp. WMMD980]|uniref:hypothetical protein n=1 Tax=Micromonospora sp. WMMD980 TaxID=3016088 RepID=UPI0024172C02|nr:hypothetical protein [Micromonospora sp. WMMD980]MDG4804770.1 hypothetical protein [Micromonospora sp. WMMD980]